MKKASANMWWIIIGAVIALVVMLILLTLFTDSSQKISKGLLSCEDKGGICDFTSNECRARDGSISFAFSCPEEQKNTGKVCCFTVEGNERN